MISFVYCVVAIVGTAAWAVMLQQWNYDIRLPIIASGLLSAMSAIVKPINLNCHFGVVTTMGSLLLLYQYAISVTMKLYGSTMQALINCNVLVIIIIRLLCHEITLSSMLCLLCLSTLTSSAALSLYAAAR